MSGGQRAGRITPVAGSTAQRPAAEETFTQGELRQVTAEAVTVGLPTLQAKTNIDVRGVGRKFSGVYHVESVRHRIDGSGYSCELTLRRNALGRSAGQTAPDTLGKQHVPPARTAASRPASSPVRSTTPRRQIVIDANTGQRR